MADYRDARNKEMKMQRDIDRELDLQLKSSKLLNQLTSTIKKKQTSEKLVDFTRMKGRSPTSVTDGYPEVNENRFLMPYGNKELLSKYKTSDKAAKLDHNGRPELFGPALSQPGFRTPIYGMGLMCNEFKSSKARSPKCADFSRSTGHEDVFDGTIGRKKFQYPKPEGYDIRNAYNSSSLMKKLPNLVNM